ncbi:MAG: nucleotidyltransferase family protein [Candidatus Berkiella sp.]
MNFFEKLLISPDTTILQALQKISEGHAQVALVVDENQKLLGTVTDGDIRRGILKSYELTDAVKNIMNTQPIKVIYDNHSKEKLIAIMVKHHIHQLPLVDKAGRVQGLQTMDELLNPTEKPNLAVIMSGGLGKRLKPLTNHLPKPMLTIGGKPLLELNINKLRAEGFRRFCITVGYKAEIIKEYFGDGSKWDISIEYIHEDMPLGTAGALHYLRDKEQNAMLVMNGDLLTQIKFRSLLEFHEKNGADCTVCIREFDYQLPYGTVELKNQKITAITEKPIYKHYVNAGVYILNPNLVKNIPIGEFYPMTTFIEELIRTNHRVDAFPLMEYWSDIGQISDYEKACQDFEFAIA